jgi:hypothetical protein
MSEAGEAGLGWSVQESVGKMRMMGAEGSTQTRCRTRQRLNMNEK